MDDRTMFLPRTVWTALERLGAQLARGARRLGVRGRPHETGAEVGDQNAQRRQAAQALHQQLDELFAIFNGLEGAVYVADIETHELLLVNQYFRDHFGEPAPSLKCYELIQDGRTAPCPFCTNDALVNENGQPNPPVVWEHQNPRNGRWYQCIDRAIHWPDGRLVRMEIAIDITPRKQAEDEVRSLSRFPAEDPSPVLRIAPDGTLLYANRASAVLRAAWERRVGQIVPDDWRTWTAAALATGAIRQIEVECADRCFSCILTPVPNAGYVNVYGRDITASKQAEAARVRLTTAVEQAAEAVLITDTEGRIEYANPAFEQISGFPRSEFLGQNPRFLKSGQHDAEFYRRLWETIRRGETWSGRFVNRRKDGTLYQEDGTISPVRDSTGAIAHFVAVKRDVTREVLLEAQLRETQKMEAVGQLAGGVAHEFNNVLTAILGCSEIITRDAAAGHPVADQAAHIRKSAERTAGLVRQLVAFGRKQIVQPQFLNLNLVVADTLQRLSPSLGPQIRVETCLDPTLGCVRADPHQMELLITNLSLNARDAMPQGGTLRVETTPANLDDTTPAEPESLGPGRYVTLAVRDTGRGMDAETRAVLFEPFFTTKSGGPGCGLGLSTVHGIVYQHGGRIVVHSVPGAGTTFRVYLPRVVDRIELPRPQPTVNARAAATLLLVEDEDEVREIERDILEAEGYAVLTADHGAAALEFCRQYAGRIDLLITDVVMPGMNGRELAEQLTRLRPNTQVLFISGYAATFLTTHGHLPPDTAFLAKPFTRTALAGKVREVLGRPPVRRPITADQPALTSEARESAPPDALAHDARSAAAPLGSALCHTPPHG